MARRLRHPAGFLAGGDASNIILIGIEDEDTWPSYSIVKHTQPNGVLVINFDGYAILTNGSETTTIENIGGGIRINAALFENIITAHGSLNLYLNGEQYGGSIYFRPYEESEPFDKAGYIRTNGTFNENTNYAATDYVDVTAATEIIYSGRVNNATMANVCAYDENKQFIEALLANQSVNNGRHISLNSNIHYVRACVLGTVTNRSLVVVYPRRGH